MSRRPPHAPPARRLPVVRWSLQALLTLFTLLPALPAFAIELTGALAGKISDAEGLPVPAALITIKSDALQGAKQASADADGNFRFMALPVGEYDVVVQSPGFHDAKARARISAGLTARLDVPLSLAQAGEAITVTDVRPPLDATNARTGTVMSREQLRDIPNAGRDYQSVMGFAPGVVGGGNPNMRGGLSFGNQYFVDGVNTTDPVTNTFSVNMNYDAIEEFQVITGGMDAEYGRAMGGAVNVVTRSGGNKFTADLQMLYSGTETQLYQPLPEEKGVPKPENADQLLAVNVGGPIIKDKLWFFTGLQLTKSLYTPVMTKEVRDIRPEGFELATRDWRSRYLFGKLTYKPSANHRIWLHAQGDPTNIDNATADPYVLPNAETWWRQGGWLASLGHQWTPGPSTVIDTQLSTNHSYIVTGPMQWKDCKNFNDVGVCQDSFAQEYDSFLPYDADGFQYGMTPDSSIDRRQRNALTFSVTQLARFLGEHQIKLGVQADLVSTYTVYPGYAQGIPYYSHNGDPSDLAGYEPSLLIKYDSDSEAEFRGSMVGVYLQDVWQPVPRITLRPGVRLDQSAFYNNVDEKVYSSLNVAPRLGFAADLDGKGTTALHAYYGRFYDPAFLSVSSILARGLNGGGYYNWDSQAGDWSSEPSYAFADSFLKHSDLQTPVSDEFDLGVSRDLGGGWLVDVNYTHEFTRNMFEDDEVNLIWNADGTEVIGSRDGSGEALFRLRTPDEAFIRYNSLEVAASRQFGDSWGVIGSYTYSRAYGRARDDQSQGLASSAMDIPQQNNVDVGIMPYDVPHNVKFAGSWRNDALWSVGKSNMGLLAGWNFNFSSGYPWRPIYWNDNYGAWNNAQEPIDGDYRLPAFSQTDLKGGLSFGAGPTAWALTVECFNVFNDRTVTGVATEADDPAGGPYLDPDGNAWQGQPIARQSPRYFQLGLRGQF
ncbi:MAG: hypothetical protein RL071_1310 [Pseudomonadota bacterium]